MKQTRTQWLFIVLLVVACVATGTLLAGADYHADSAHGNTSYGVDRSTADCSQWPGGDCNVGSCAHCHDTFDDSICGLKEEMLFYTPTDETFCYQCHKSSGSVQVGGINNYMYSKTFGGEAANHGITSVYDAFNASGSSHDLTAVLNWVVTNHPEWGFTPDSNPCLICHDHHLSRANKQHPTDPTKTAIRRPSEYGTGNLWGDDPSERMSVNWSTYKSPYFNNTSTYEPGGTSSSDGTGQIDYATFCQDCHVEIWVPGDDCNQGVDWKAEFCPNRSPIHGEDTDWDPAEYGSNKAPWPAEGDYVLSCLDCHEPHGSSNWHLLRTEVNNSSVTWTARPSKNSPGDFCFACHKDVSSSHYNWYTYCDECHTHGGDRPI